MFTFLFCRAVQEPDTRAVDEGPAPEMTSVEIVFLGVYFAVLCVLAVYGSHRYRMAFLYYRHKFKIPTPNGTLAQLPRVTVQLPVYNEMYVAERLIEAVCRSTTRASRLEIQVLDDSTDETMQHRRAPPWSGTAARGQDITYIHRTDRSGFKAGALENGLLGREGRATSRSSTPTSCPPLTSSAHACPTSPTRRSAWSRGAGATSTASFSHRSPRSRRSSSTATSSSSTPRGNRCGLLLQLQRDGRHLAAGDHRDAGGWEHDTLTEDLDLSLPRPARRAGSSSTCPSVGVPVRAAGRHQRLQEPAAPLGQGLRPDRPQAARRPSCALEPAAAR